ncbi:hypothetical protein COOONC_04267 [Cooperia oncophora]
MFPNWLEEMLMLVFQLKSESPMPLIIRSRRREKQLDSHYKMSTTTSDKILIMLRGLDEVFNISVSSQQCPGNGVMTDDLRSSLAKGLQENDMLGLAPPATNMEKMSSAIQSARRCSGDQSQLRSRPSLEENIMTTNNLNLDVESVAEMAMSTWWSQLASNGVDEPDMRFTSALRFRSTNPILSFSRSGEWNYYMTLAVTGLVEVFGNLTLNVLLI